MSPEDERNIGDLISLRARALVVLLLPLTTAQVWTSLRILNREVLFIIIIIFFVNANACLLCAPFISFRFVYHYTPVVICNT